MLQGDHAIVINDERRNILIERVEVAAEGGVAYWSAPRKGLIRILDFGSGTVNGATLLDGKYVDRDSFTMAFGTETLDLSNAEAFVRAVFIKAQQKRWKRTDTILIVGWSAESMLQLVQKHYENAEVLRPRDPNREGLVYISPVFANAVGMYRVAQEVFK
jgi:plasmid segregation protein ParM